MDDDTEILDWGHEEEEGDVAGSEQHSFAADDGEDAVSLGGDEEDEFLTYQCRVPQGTIHHSRSPPKNVQQTTAKQEGAKGHAEAQSSPQLPQEQQKERANSGTPQKHKDTSKSSASEQSPLLSRTHSLGKLAHSLPPKPVVSSVPFVHPSHPSIIEATAMASRSDRDKRNGAGSNSVAHDTGDQLPSGWEVKYPRSGRGLYYYNVHTQESTWTRPTSAATRGQRGQRSDPRDDSIDKALPSKNDEILISRVGRSDGGDMSYDDRHYRPGDNGRREDRPPTSTHLITGDTYIPDVYVPGQRNGRSSPAPSRTRDSDLGLPPRRPISPAGSYGDRDSMQSSYREVPAVLSLSAEDRTWVACDVSPIEHPREHRERDHDSVPSDRECRNLPRDTDRSSTLRPKSPVFYSRDSQESATILHTPSKSTQPISEAPPARQKSRFPQADVPVQFDHRQLDIRDSSTRQGRTDDIAPSSSRHTNDDIPSSRLLSDARGGGDISKPSASDAQRSGSRKRTPLPPQSEVFRPGSRLGTVQRDSGYLSSGLIAPAQISALSSRETRNAGRTVPSDGPRDSTRRTPSPSVPQVDFPIAERSDRAGSRKSKSRANGPMQMTDSYISSKDRDRVVAVDVDDAPPPRLFDSPPRHSLPKRPITQDEVPRYPRAMLGADGDGTSRGSITGHDARETKETKHGSFQDEPSHSGPARDRPQEERHPPVAPCIFQQEPTCHSVESKLLAAPNVVRLSGTNNTPIGTRNRFSGGLLPHLASGDGRQGAVVMPENNAEPVSSRLNRTSKDYGRTPHFDVLDGQRIAATQSGRRVDASPSLLSSPHALPPAEPGGPTILLSRPSRSALGMSRFGPPIVKESAEPTHSQRNASLESLRCDPLPENSSRATPPPLSRESSMTSICGAAGQSGLPTHLPPRPQSPPRGYRYRTEDDSQGQHCNRVQSSVDYSRRRDDADMEPPPRQRPATQTPKRRTMDSYVPEPPPPSRDTYITEPLRASFQDTRGDHYIAQPAPMTQDEELGRAPSAMHPERALMLQPNGLPPRPSSALGRAGRGSKRERREDRERAETLWGNGSRRFASASPGGGEKRRYPRTEGGAVAQGGGASLLDRLTLDDGGLHKSPSLRDRVQLPSKRDREEMLAGDVSMNQDVDEGSKRLRRRGMKSRKGRR